MAIISNIQKILDTRLKSLPSNPYIAWPNTQFQPANSTSYIRPTLLMATTDLYTLNNHERLPGLYQVDIFGQLNRGVQQVYSLADEIRDWFDADREYTEGTTTLYIQAISSGTTQEVQGAWYRVFVEINFLAFN